MSALINMAPQKAILAETGQVVDARDVKINTTLAVKAGEVVPIDGIVVEGWSEVDERTLTGESFPVAKQVQSLVWAGTLNIDGYISVKTTAFADNSAVAKMVRLVEEAQNSRSKTQRLIDSHQCITAAVVIVSAGIALVPLVMGAHNKKHWFQLALVLLVSACPCALVLSTPVATFCALLKAASTGLFIKGGDVLEALAKVRVVAEDKVRIIKDLKNREGPTAMVGDGMNDAAALAMANVGISMGISGSGVATETSHITLMSNDVCKIPKAIQLARRTHCKIIWNILFSGITKVVILVLAFAGHPIMWAAVLADVGTCHGHEKAHEHDCHDQGKSKRGSKYNCLTSCKRQHCYMESSENIHCAEPM